GLERYRHRPDLHEQPHCQRGAYEIGDKDLEKEGPISPVLEDAARLLRHADVQHRRKDEDGKRELAEGDHKVKHRASCRERAPSEPVSSDAGLETKNNAGAETWGTKPPVQDRSGMAAGGAHG